MREDQTIHKGFKIFIILLGIGFLVLFKPGNMEKIIEVLSLKGREEKALELVESLQGEETTLDINIYDNTIIQWTPNKLSIFNMDKAQTSYKDFNFLEPEIHYGEEKIYIVDKSLGDIDILDQEGQSLDKFQLDQEIFGLKESYENIIIQGKSSEKENIKIFNKDKILMGNYIYEDRKILTCASDREAKRNVVATTDLMGDKLISKLDIYGENNNKLGEISITNEIVVYLKIISRDKVIILTDNKVHMLKDDEIIWSYELGIIKDIYISENEIYLLHNNYLEIIDFKGRQKEKIGLAEEFEKILAMEKGILLYGPNRIIIMNRDREILRHEEDIINLSVNNDNILLLSSDKLKLYKVVDK